MFSFLQPMFEALLAVISHEISHFSALTRSARPTRPVPASRNLRTATASYFDGMNGKRSSLTSSPTKLSRLVVVFVMIPFFPVAATATPGEDLAVAHSQSALQYISKSYQEAELIVKGMGSRDSHIRRLHELQKTYSPKDLETGDRAKEAADLFWQEVARQFLPAVEANDEAATSASFERLVKIYSPVNPTTSPASSNPAQIGNKDIAARIDASSLGPASDSMLTGLKWAAIPIAATACLFWFLWHRRKIKLASKSDLTAQRRAAEKQAHDLLDIKLVALRDALYAHGQPRREKDKLFFGNYAVNGNNEIVDQVKRDFGCFATIFMGDTRIATNVLLGNGSRALDTPLVHGPAYETVVQKKRLFAGTVNLFGRSILSLYEPIFSGTDVIGILFVGS